MQTSWYWFRTGPTRFSRWLSVVGCGYVTLNPFSSLATSLRTSEPVVRRRSGAVHGRRWTRAIETRQETKFSPRRRWVASRIATTQRGDDVIALKHDHRSTSWYLDALAEAQNWRNRGYRGQLSHVFRHWIIHCKMFQFLLQKASTYCLIGIELPKVTLILRFFYKFRFSRDLRAHCSASLCSKYFIGSPSLLRPGYKNSCSSGTPLLLLLHSISLLPPTMFDQRFRYKTLKSSAKITSCTTRVLSDV